jgi:predicted permease
MRMDRDRIVARLAAELGWASRNVRARGWRAGLVVALLGTALAANTIVFSAADSLVFHRVPFRDPDRLVEIQRYSANTRRPADGMLSPALLDEWRTQRDLFDGVHGYLSKVIFLTASRGEPELVNAADITVGLPELLGVRPRYGRSLVDGDDRQADPQPVLVADSLARERFGDPAGAVGQKLETTGVALIVVGVMPSDFRYPYGTTRIWRALDPRGPLVRGFAGVFSVARLAPGHSPELVSRMVSQRSAAIGRAAGANQEYRAVAAPIAQSRSADDQRRMFLLLVGAALCLLFTACANVASLELASAVGRARTYAIQLAVGASRASLARTALAEGVLLVGAATIAATGLTYAGVGVLTNILPTRIGSGSVNPIDLDGRAFLFMLAVAAATWALSTLPVVFFAARTNLLDVIKLEGPSAATSSGGAFLRRLLSVAEIALAVVLLAGSVLYVRSYLGLLRIDKGFDSSGVAAINFTIPPQLFGSGADRAALAQTILDRVRRVPGVSAAFEGWPPPDTGDSPTMMSQIEVDARGPADTDILLPRLRVDPDYFKVLRIPLVAGRMFEPGDPTTNIIISRSLARRLWPPDGDAVGHRYRGSSAENWKTVIGVVGHVRLAEEGTAMSGRNFQTYVMRQPPPPPPPAPPAGTRRVAEGGMAYGRMTITARLDSRERAREVYQAVRAIEPRFILDVEFVDDEYANVFGDRLLAARVISAFGVLAFLVAAVGIYGLMAFLVAIRTREIGIRLAMGASPTDVTRLVLSSSVRLAIAGAAIGVAGAAGLSRWMQSQLYGVSGTDPATLGVVAAGVVATAIAATWLPARRAATIDPSTLLK